MSPYVGMVQKQDGSSNGCISNYTAITWLGMNVTHFDAKCGRFSAMSHAVLSHIDT